jgi:hypothetical protein
VPKSILPSPGVELKGDPSVLLPPKPMSQSKRRTPPPESVARHSPESSKVPQSTPNLEPVPDPTGAEPSKQEKDAIDRARSTLRNSKNSVAVRVAAAKELERLGEKAKSACRDLCEAMVESNSKLKDAAVEALERIDPQLYKRAMAIYQDGDTTAVVAAGALKEEALMPIILGTAGNVLLEMQTRKLDPAGALHDQEFVSSSLQALAQIAPADPKVIQLTLQLITHTNPQVRLTAARQVRQLKETPKAVDPLLRVALLENNEEICLEAIQSLVSIADETTSETVWKRFHEVRFQRPAKIRDAMEAAMEKLDQRKNPQKRQRPDQELDQ